MHKFFAKDPIPANEMGKDEEDFCGIFVWRIVSTGIEILTFTYKKGDRPETIKVPGGCMASGDGSAEQAVVSELEQETGLRFIGCHIEADLPFARPDGLVHVYTNYVSPGKHHQHFFAVPFKALEGALRTHPMFDDDEELGVPKWIPIDGALECLFRTHKRALEYGVAALGSPRFGGTMEFRQAASKSPLAAKFLTER